MTRWWIPAILRPDFVWKPQPFNPSSGPMPPIPKPSSLRTRRFWGRVHYLLFRFSIYYCRWVGIPFKNSIVPLPFGLLLKWSDGTRLEEVLTTQVARAAGLPSPQIISYGDHPDTPWAPMSILMKRLPGRQLCFAYRSLSPEAKATTITEFKRCFETIRGWKSPFGDERICSITGGDIRSLRVPGQKVGPCRTAKEFHDYCIAWQSKGSWMTEAEYEELLSNARRLPDITRPGVVFTHGDIQQHNFLIDDDGHITGFLDWEMSGWYPEYFDFTVALRGIPVDFWWHDFLMAVGSDRYREERICDRALKNLTGEWVV